MYGEIYYNKHFILKIALNLSYVDEVDASTKAGLSLSFWRPWAITDTALFHIKMYLQISKIPLKTQYASNTFKTKNCLNKNKDYVNKKQSTYYFPPLRFLFTN